MMRFGITATLTIFFAVSAYSQVYLDVNASIDERVEDLLGQMTLQEKVGQMVQAEKGGVESSNLEDIKTYFLGSVLSGGGSVPNPNTVDAWVSMYNNMQNKAASTHLGIPILYGIDAVHGHNNLKDAVIFPHNIGLGCTRNPELVQECARITAQEVAATGLNWTFSPCIAVPQNEFWGRTYEGFSESPDLVDSLGKSEVLGYQSDSLGTKNYVLACAKHYVGDGGTVNGIDQGNTVISEEILRSIHLKPYYSAIEAGVGTVMASYNSWNSVKCHGNKYLLTDVLKNEMGFNGFIVSDWNGINQVDGDFKTAIQKSVNAGVDMAMQPYDYVSFINNLIALVNEGKVTQQRIDDAVRRILTIKFQMGLFENHQADLSLKDSVGSEAHRKVARQAVRESLVLLKNDGILPLNKLSGKILVAGSKANDIGALCGGWTISWQGGLGDITKGTTIYNAVTRVVGAENAILATSSSQVSTADYAIVVVGENPYAEGRGDVVNSSGFSLSTEDQAMITAIKNKGIPMVVVLLSGRPLEIKPELETSNAFIAAWLPGTEGGLGIADVIFGDYIPTGKLSHTWPYSYYDVPLNITADANGKTSLFPYGYGLTYHPAGINEKTKSLVTFDVFPNPGHEFVTIRTNSFENNTVKLIDFTGKVCLEKQFEGKGSYHISLQGLNPGIYLLQISRKQGMASKQLLIE